MTRNCSSFFQFFLFSFYFFGFGGEESNFVDSAQNKAYKSWCVKTGKWMCFG